VELAPALPREVITDAPKRVLVDVRNTNARETIAVVANLTGLGTPGFAPVDASFSLAVDVGGFTVRSVTLTSPGEPDRDVPFVADFTRVRFAIDVRSITAAIVTLG
jgi:hypothetical protein